MSATLTDHYTVLGVSPHASSKEIRDAYLIRARQTHPDKVEPHQRELATGLFQKVATAFGVLGDADRRAEYDRALREAKSAQVGYQCMARRPPPPAGRPGARPPSPSHRRPPSPRAFAPLAPSSPIRQWADPYVDPYQLFHQIFNKTATPSGTGFRDMYDDPYKDPDYMRPFERDTLENMLGDILPPDDPFRRALPREADLLNFDGRGRGGGGDGQRWDGGYRPWEAISKDPWGRRLEGGIQAGGHGRPRRLSTTLMEGERHRNGDFQVRKQTHNVEEGNDGILRFSTHTVEMRHYSGQARTARSPSHDRYGARMPREPEHQRGRRSSSHDRYYHPLNYQDPRYPTAQTKYPAIEGPYASRNLPALPAPPGRRPLALEDNTARYAPLAITGGGHGTLESLMPPPSRALVPTGGEMGLTRRASSRR